jgi:hypothetical protein
MQESLTKNQYKNLKDKLTLALNVYDFRIEVTEKEIKITIGDSHLNMVDSASLNSILQYMKDNDIVSSFTNTMWVGLENNNLVVWCLR